MLSATHSATLGILIAGTLFGQHYDASRAFETASIKPHASGRTKSPSIQDGILTGTNVTLKHLLQLAEALHPFSQAGLGFMSVDLQPARIVGVDILQTEGFAVLDTVRLDQCREIHGCCLRID